MLPSRARRAPNRGGSRREDRKSTRLNSSHGYISYAVFCLKKKDTQLFHIWAGTVVTATLPVQVQFIVGDPTAGVAAEGRSYTAVPSSIFFFNDTATTEIYTLSLHDALPI